jgi:trehalose synthase
MSADENPRLQEIEVQAIDAARLEPLIGTERMARFEHVAEAARESLAGSSVLNVNSTGAGGGVAEMLQTLLSYARGAGIDARWLVIEGDPAFFAITKRVHNGLYGSPGDGGDLGSEEHRHYEHVLRDNARELRALFRPGDVVVIHDPQPAGLAAAAKSAGAHVVWRCHVGLDRANEWSERAWEFLRPYLTDTDAIVVSRAAFAPPWADPGQVHVIQPSIDPFSAKNEPVSGRNGRAVHPPRRISRADQPACRRRPDGPTNSFRRSTRRPDLSLGPDEGHGRRDERVRSARRSVTRRAPAPLRPSRHGCRRRSRGR